MAKSGGQIANLILRCTSPLSRLCHCPILGDILSWTSCQLVLAGTLIWVQIQHGHPQDSWMHVNPRTDHNVLHGNGGPTVQQTMQQHLRPGMSFYDLGANIGFFSLLAACLVGRSGRVVSFEADSEITTRLADNLSDNYLANTTVEEQAVWSESTTVSFARVGSSASPYRGFGHVSVGEAAVEGAISAEAISLDQYFFLHPAPGFFKCDVERAEVGVSEGAERLLRENRPVFPVEMDSEEIHRSLLLKFQQCGYACDNLDENHVLALTQ